MFNFNFSKEKKYNKYYIKKRIDKIMFCELSILMLEKKKK